jgi:hypothetical protein
MQLPCFLCGRLRLPSDGRAPWHLPVISPACSAAQDGARAACRWKALQPGMPGGAPDDAVGRLGVWPASSAAVALSAMDPGYGGAPASFGSIHFTSAPRVPAAPQSVEYGAAHRRPGVRRSVRPRHCAAGPARECAGPARRGAALGRSRFPPCFAESPGGGGVPRVNSVYARGAGPSGISRQPRSATTTLERPGVLTPTSACDWCPGYGGALASVGSTGFTTAFRGVYRDRAAYRAQLTVGRRTR